MSKDGFDDLQLENLNRYEIVILAAKRAVELNEGAAKLVETSATTKLSTVSLREIAAGKVTLKNAGEQEEEKE